MAKLTKRGNSYYIDYFNNGQRVRKSVGRSKATAETIFKDLEVKLAREESGLFLREISTGDFLKKVDVYFGAHHRPRTLGRYRRILVHFKKFFDIHMTAKISTLRTSYFEEYKTFRLSQTKEVAWAIKRTTDKYSPISKNTINLELKVFKHMFNLALKWEHIRHNPLMGIEYFKKENKLPRFYSIDEARRIINNSLQPYQDIFSILLATGMRRDELRYLEVKDIDFDSRQIKIQSKEFWKPKTGERNIPMYDGICPVFHRICKERQNGFLFVQEGTCLPHSENRWLCHLTGVLKRLELPKGGIHTFRHTFGAMAVADDMNIRKLQAIFGHADLKTTQLYSNMDKKHLLSSINKVGSIGTILSHSSSSEISMS